MHLQHLICLLLQMSCDCYLLGTVKIKVHVFSVNGIESTVELLSLILAYPIEKNDEYDMLLFSSINFLCHVLCKSTTNILHSNINFKVHNLYV